MVPSISAMLYLFLGTMAHLVIGMSLITAEYPVYATYELAPRAVALSALTDQQIAGTVMIVLTEPLVLLAVTILFFRSVAAGPYSPHTLLENAQ